MKGDFSRGSHPDRKRGRDYRRVLLQQGRLLLDSDYNAGIDAQDQLIRELASDLGCPAGSPDLGFLVTPGRLLALFDPSAKIEPEASGTAVFVRDYSRKYLDRFPSLQLTGGTGGGTVTLPLMRKMTGDTDIALWVRAESATPVTVNTLPVNVPGQEGFARRQITLTDPERLQITLGADEKIWLALVETYVPSGPAPLFGVETGTYYLQGLTLDADHGPLALFDLLSGQMAEPTGDITSIRDDAVRLAQTLPSLRVQAAAGGGGGSVRLPFRFPVSGHAVIDLWLRADTDTDYSITGVGDFTAPGQPEFFRQEFNMTDPDSLVMLLDAGEEIWLARAELRSGGGFRPGLWPGVSFAPRAGFDVPDFAFPDAGSPGGSRPLQAGDRLVAYLEGWERHVTGVEDAGVVERALGRDEDTCTRTRETGQVKVAPSANLAADADTAAREILQAFATFRNEDGTLVVDTRPQADDADPCALPTTGGYTGNDHRLYRFEVHGGGVVGTDPVVIKWSRDNGSELFAVLNLESGAVEVAPESALQDGDLVEILSDAIELGDAQTARIDGASADFDPPARRTGDLVRLVDTGTVGNGTRRRFEFRDRIDETVSSAITLADYGDPSVFGAKVRRWHGTIEPTVPSSSPVSVSLEDGISVTVRGRFRPGQWWQYEARTGGLDNANGPWRAQPHGPERLFAPLALLEFQGPNQPLALLAWLDRRFSSLCGLDADDIAFDGHRVGSDSDTVQEVIEELYEREAGGCCDITLEPEDAGDDALRIREALEEFARTADVVVCLKKGTYRFRTGLPVAHRRLEIRGCPEAVILAEGPAVLFRVGTAGRLALQDLTLFAPEGVRTLVRMDTDAATLEARNAGLVNLTLGEDVSAVLVNGGSIDPNDLENPFLPAPGPEAFVDRPAVRMEDCAVLAGKGVFGGTLSGLALKECVLVTTDSAVAVKTIGMADLNQSALRTGVDLTPFAAWTAESLLHRSEERLAEALSSLTPGGQAPAFAAEVVMAGTIRRTFITGRLGMLMGQARLLTMETNSIMAAEAGIMCKEATSFRFEGGKVMVNGAGPGAGLHFAHNAFSLRIAESEISCDDVAIMLMAPKSPEDLTAPAGAMIGVDIQDNTIIAEIGIQLGRFAQAALNGSAVGVHIRGNSIASGLTGLLLRGRAQEPPEPQTVDVHVSDNTIAAAIGIGVSGPKFSITGNRISPGPLKTPNVGILAVWSHGILVRDNQISADLAEKRYRGIQLEVCNFAVVQGNVLGMGNHALEVKNMVGFSVADNTLLSPGIRMDQCSGFRLQGNAIGGQTAIAGAGNATISGNRITGGAHVRQMWGGSDIHGNRIDLDLILEPAAETTFDFGLAGFAAAVMAEGMETKAAGNHAVMAAVHMLAGEDPPESSEGPFMVSRGKETPRNPSEATRVISAEKEMDSVLGNTLAVALDNAFFGSLMDGLVLDEAAPAFTLVRERLFSVQVNDNACTGLRIGHPYTEDGKEHVQVRTVVQAIGNYVVNTLAVRPYPRRNISQNVAKTYSPWVLSQSAAVNADNLDLP